MAVSMEAGGRVGERSCAGSVCHLHTSAIKHMPRRCEAHAVVGEEEGLGEGERRVYLWTVPLSSRV